MPVVAIDQVDEVYIFDPNQSVLTNLTMGAAVIRKQNDQKVRFPTVENDKEFVGVIIVAPKVDGDRVLVRKSGLVTVKCSAAVKGGHLLNLDDITDDGQVKPISEAAGTLVNVVGIAQNDSYQPGGSGQRFVDMIIAPFSGVRISATTAGALCGIVGW